ncbi:MAG TPA: hypothetical protein VMG40_09495 [Bryobacteraceae bacterium]|nr:hypothetical protein [Bryobacteraceae bacterium]
MSSIDLAYLEKITVETELAIKRLERMIEFLRIVYQEEAAALNENQPDEPKLFIR